MPSLSQRHASMHPPKPIAKLLGRAPRIQRSVQNECVPHKHRCPAPFFFHLHAVSKPFYANRPSLVNRNVTMRDRFRYFNAMVPLVACLGCRLLRSIVGPLGDVDWTLAWHELFLEGVEFVTTLHGWKTRSAVCLGEFPRNCKIFVFNLPKKLGCETFKLVPRKRSTSWPPCLHFGFDARTFFAVTKKMGNWRQHAPDTSYLMNEVK